MRLIAALAVIATSAIAAMMLSASAQAVAPEQCGVDYLNACQHWGNPTAQRVVVPVRYVNIDPQLVANVAAEWSRSPVVELRVVGPGAYESCLWTDQFERGVITVCGDGYYGECCPMGWIGSFINDDYPNPARHIVGASVHVVSYYGPEKMRHSLCHELGHAIGLNHPVAPYPGCMGGGDAVGSDLLPWQCPGERDYALLADLYGHVDGYSTALPATAASHAGNYYCSAPSPPPTVTATPTPSPTAAPCYPPKSKRCR